MSAIDPLRRANILVHAGRVDEALESLRSAIEANPEREDLKARFDEVQAENPKMDFLVLVHLCVSWVFLWGPAVAVSLLVRWGVCGLDAASGASGPTVSALLLGFVLAVSLALAAYSGSLHLWFLYLKYVAGRRLASVEKRLPGFVWVDRLEPIYGRVRARYLPPQNET